MAEHHSGSIGFMAMDQKTDGVRRERAAERSLDAMDRKLVGVLVEDATESYFPAFKSATLEMVRAQGAIVGWTATTDEFLETLGV